MTARAAISAASTGIVTVVLGCGEPVGDLTAEPAPEPEVDAETIGPIADFVRLLLSP